MKNHVHIDCIIKKDEVSRLKHLIFLKTLKSEIFIS